MRRKGRGKLYTTAELFRIINDELKAKGLIPDHIDYSLATSEKINIKAAGWDCIFVVMFGGNEGIYLDIFLRGDTGNIWYGDVCVGTYKTLRTDKEAYADLANLGTEFVFAVRDFAIDHSSDFDWSGYKITFYSGDEKKVTYITYEDTPENFLERIFERENYDKAVVFDNWTKKEHTVAAPACDK